LAFAGGAGMIPGLGEDAPPEILGQVPPGDDGESVSVPLTIDGRTLRRLTAAAFALFLISECPAWAQAPRSQPASRPAAADGATSGRTGECAQLPGGRAPVEKIAGLSGMSPRDLDLAYFGKPLADLSDEDFERIGHLSRDCGAGAGILAADTLKSFEAVVRAAQQNRRTLLEGIKKQMVEITAMPVARDKLIRLNELSDQLIALERILPRGDIKATVTWIAKQNQALYDAAPKPSLATTAQAAAPTTDPWVTVAPAPARTWLPGGEEN
jgi:hypothetical protein